MWAKNTPQSAKGSARSSISWMIHILPDSKIKNTRVWRQARLKEVSEPGGKQQQPQAARGHGQILPKGLGAYVGACLQLVPRVITFPGMKSPVTN